MRVAASLSCCALVASCSSSLVIPVLPDEGSIIALVALDAGGAILRVSTQAARDGPHRTNVMEDAAHFLAIVLPQPVDLDGRPLLDPIAVGAREGCGCAVPAPRGPLILGVGDECPIPAEATVVMVDRSGEREVGEVAERLIADTVAGLGVRRDASCRPPPGEHGFATQVEVCDVLPSPGAATYGIDGEGRILSLGRSGEARVLDGRGGDLRWRPPHGGVVRGLPGGGFLVAGVTERVARAGTRVQLGDGAPVTTSVPIDAPFASIDDSALDPSDDGSILVGHGEDRGVVVAECGAHPDRCAAVTLPCTAMEARVALEADGRLLAIAHRDGLLWKTASGWQCVATDLPDDRRPLRVVQRGGRVLVYAAHDDGTAGALYGTAAPLGSGSRFELLSEQPTLRAPLLVHLDDGSARLVDDLATVIIGADASLRTSGGRDLPAIGGLHPVELRSTGDWQAFKLGSGDLMFHQRGGPYRAPVPLLPAGRGPLVALADGRALALEDDGALVLDATGGCDTGTATRDARWPTGAVVAARTSGPGEELRLVIGGDQPAPWIRWSTAGNAGPPLTVLGAAQWRAARSFGPDRVVLLDTDGQVFVAHAGRVDQLIPEYDDPLTPAIESNGDTYYLLEGCDGVAWVAGDGPTALARIAPDGRGGFRMEGFWGRRAQHARDPHRTPERFQHLAVACLGPSELLLTADVRDGLVDTVASARYRIGRDGVERSIADTAGRLPDEVALGWTGAVQHLLYVHPDRLARLDGSVQFFDRIRAFVPAAGGAYLAFEGPVRRYLWVRAF